MQSTAEAPERVDLPNQWHELPDGFHEATMEEYLGWPLVSNGGLDILYRRTPRNLRHALDEGVDDGSASKALGTLTHTAVFEPDLLTTLYVPKPVPDGEIHRTKDGDPSSNPASTTAYAEAVAEVQQANPDKQLVEMSDWAPAIAMRDAIHKHPDAQMIIQAEGPVELSAIATDPETGVRVKIRPDKLIPGIGFEINLKTTRNARYESFQWDIYKYGYFRGTALYSLALRWLGWEWKRGLYLAVESDPPHNVAVYDADPGLLDAGEQMVGMLLRRAARCFEKDEWPGHPEGINSITLPHRAWDRIDEELRNE